MTNTLASQLAQMYAEVATIEGMKADNAYAAANGSHPIYVGVDFTFRAARLEELSTRMKVAE